MDSKQAKEGNCWGPESKPTPLVSISPQPQLQAQLGAGHPGAVRPFSLMTLGVQAGVTDRSPKWYLKLVFPSPHLPSTLVINNEPSDISNQESFDC